MITIKLGISRTDPLKLNKIIKKINENYKIIIVDNSSNYNFSKINISHKTSIIRSENVGNGAAINKALKKCETRFAMYKSGLPFI